jgi:signal transduction histidine kinase
MPACAAARPGRRNFRLTIAPHPGAAAGDGKLSASVTDTGIGIRPEQLRLLFEAFRQLDCTPRKLHEATGLGLHPSRKLLDLMDDDIEVGSRFRCGSRFSFTVTLNLGTGKPPAAQ